VHPSCQTLGPLFPYEATSQAHRRRHLCRTVCWRSRVVVTSWNHMLRAGDTSYRKPSHNLLQLPRPHSVHYVVAASHSGLACSNLRRHWRCRQLATQTVVKMRSRELRESEAPSSIRALGVDFPESRCAEGLAPDASSCTRARAAGLTLPSRGCLKGCAV
jgi:hypothetical protein